MPKRENATYLQVKGGSFDDQLPISPSRATRIDSSIQLQPGDSTNRNAATAIESQMNSRPGSRMVSDMQIKNTYNIDKRFTSEKDLWVPQPKYLAESMAAISF